jgi:hypothetical protein
MSRAILERRIAQGRGDEPADLVLKGGTVWCLVTGDRIAGDVAICGDTIVGIGADYAGRRVIDVSGQLLVPGFIDTHLHIESSCITPFEFDRCVAPRGVTTAICDPHEIANVAGSAGIRYFLAAAERTVMDIRVNLSSCVPSTHMETAGAELDAEALLALRDHPKVLGLAEFMNFPGVIHRDPGCMEKLAAFAGEHIDGHAPLLSGRDLNRRVGHERHLLRAAAARVDLLVSLERDRNAAVAVCEPSHAFNLERPEVAAVGGGDDVANLNVCRCLGGGGLYLGHLVSPCRALPAPLCVRVSDNLGVCQDIDPT